MAAQSRRAVPDGGRDRSDGADDDALADADDDALADADRVVILNPASGTGDHAGRVRELAAEHGIAVVETAEPGDAVDLAREAAEAGASLVAAAGGDGTVNAVVRGVVAADALGSATVGVIPAGTGNNFAGNIGVTDVESAFELLDSGERRRLDLGLADDRPFVNSLVGGLTAEASEGTTSEAKERFGVLAYVLTTLRLLGEFDGFRLTVEGRGSGDPAWDGTALVVLVGNARRFGFERHAPANAEDGLLDVTVVESMPPADLLGEAALARLFGAESDHVTRFLTPGLTVDLDEAGPVEFSLDGEMVPASHLSVGVRPRALAVCVGDGYDPEPDGYAPEPDESAPEPDGDGPEPER